MTDNTEQTRWPKVAIGIPSNGFWRQETAHSLMLLMAYMAQKYCAKGMLELSIVTTDGTLLPQSRNTIVERAQAMNCTHVFWVDSDMKFPRDALERLLSRQLPFVGANYSQRRSPAKPTVAGLDGNWIYEDGQTGTEQVKFVGHGVCLVEMSVYEHVPKPWYMLGWSESKQCIIGEDVWFCNAARAAGCPVHVDHDLSAHVEHIGEHAYTHSDALARRQELAEAQAKEAACHTT